MCDGMQALRQRPRPACASASWTRTFELAAVSRLRSFYGRLMAVTLFCDLLEYRRRYVARRRDAQFVDLELEVRS
jgi:hypothetical protein